MLDTVRLANIFSVDSVRRIGRVFTYTARIYNIDTTRNYNFFDERGYGRASNNEYEFGGEMMFTAPTSLVLWRATVSHAFHATATSFFTRDTTIGRDLTSVPIDSIEINQHLHMRYVRAQGTILGVPVGVQQVWPLIGERNQFGSYGHYNFSGRWKVPELLGALPAIERGVRTDHWLIVTLWFVEKVPGKIYW